MKLAYGEDLAWVHHDGFGAFARRSAPGLLALFRDAGIESGRVVDLGCGSGIWAAALGRAGYDAHGIDSSRHMIALAREVAPAATLVNESLWSAELPPCRAVTSLGECVNYLFDGKKDRRATRSFFRRVHAALEPGGVFAFDFAEPGRSRGGYRGFTEGAGWSIQYDVSENARRTVLVRRIVVFRRAGETWRRSEETHELRLFRAPDLAGQLREAGFRARIVRGYGEFRFPPSYAAIIARKPAKGGGPARSDAVGCEV
ncbi:MAG: class I SAM-dependent methyltransferase [Gemmatimonadetes bacterium]|nr:class I SAM-dependent methyltransferase [Gemmatimonadota bacterium]